MASIIGVETLQHTNGTTAATIDSSGRILTPARPAFFAYDTTTIWQNLGGTHEVVMASTDYNVGSHYSTSTGRFTAPVAGLYHFSGKIYVNQTATSSQFYVTTNGQSQPAKYFYVSQENSAGDSSVAFSEVRELSSGDYVSIIGLAGEYYKAYSTFSGYLIG